jgi:hypothetical protein
VHFALDGADRHLERGSDFGDRLPLAVKESKDALPITRESRNGIADPIGALPR